MLIDSHCHLDYPEFAAELDAVMARAHAAGVGLMLTISTSLATFPRVLGVAERYPHVYCTVGIHPHEAEKEADAALDTLLAACTHPKVVGIGESGLDYFYEHSPREVQVRLFRLHIEAARATALPLIVHTRDADQETAEILRSEAGKGGLSGLLHCFSSGADLAQEAIALGFYISFSGILTFKKAGALRAVAASLPVERLLVETDAPYLAPVPHRGKRNEPAYVAHTAETLAGLRGMSPAALAEVTRANFMRLFKKVPEHAGVATS